MRRIQSERREFLESVEDVVRRFIPDLIQAFRFFNEFNQRVRKGIDGRVHLDQHEVYLRRQAVRYLYDAGFNPAEIANRLGIPVKHAYNGIARHPKSKGRGSKS